MGRYILSRLFQMAVTLFVLSVIVFLLARVLGDPIDFMLPLDASPGDVERLREMLGFNDPLHIQYLDFLGGLLRGDLGVSLRQQLPVADVIASRLWPSLSLALFAMAWAVPVSIFLGTVSAVRQGTFIDRVVRLLAVVGQAAPSFWVGLVLVQFFSVRLGLFPAAGIGGIDHYVLPGFTLGLLAIVGLTRLLRSSMLEVLDADYITKARIMGVPEMIVILRHALRNALLPVMTYAGELLALLVTAGVVVEVVFAWPGLGRLAYEAVFTRDYPLIQGVVIVIALTVMLVNLLVDLAYAWVDPRIRYDRE